MSVLQSGGQRSLGVSQVPWSKLSHVPSVSIYVYRLHLGNADPHLVVIPLARGDAPHGELKPLFLPGRHFATPQARRHGRGKLLAHALERQCRLGLHLEPDCAGELKRRSVDLVVS